MLLQPLAFGGNEIMGLAGLDWAGLCWTGIAQAGPGWLGWCRNLLDGVVQDESGVD